MTDNDASVRADLCPDGYNFLHHPRVGCRGGSTGLIFRDFLHVASVNVGQKESFEFSERTIKSSDHSIRLLIVYHPRYSTENKELKVPLSVFLREFSEYLSTLILAKEPIVIAGDFNIHVDVVDDPEII